ncbi:MAG: DUF4332 domain-containing protein [Planctomycetaceae bacterium]
MEFQRIQIDGFGTLAEQKIDDLSSGLNVYYGANGSGKTTILHFLRGVFCGFDEARRLNLLPPIKGGTPGGSLTLNDGPSQFTVVRRGRADHADALAIQVRRGSPDQAEALRSRIERLDTDLVQLLYFVGSYEAHSLSGLVHLALRDGIDLTTTRRDATWIAPLTQSLATRRRSLWDGPSVPRTIGQRQTAHDHAAFMADQTERQQQTRQEAVVEELQRVRMHLQRLEGEYTWLISEIQPVEADLTECQTRLWSRRTRTIRDVQRIAQAPETIEAGWVRELHELDRQIEHAKQVLRDLAAARLRLTLDSTGLVCAETPDESTTLQLQRDLLTQLEHKILRVQQDCEGYRESHARGTCECGAGLASFQQQLTEMRQTVYVLCQQISRRQTVLNRQRWVQEQARIDQCEAEVLERIRRLRTRREELMATSNDPVASRVRHAVNHELLHCRCEQHAAFAAMLPSESETVSRPIREVVSERIIEETDARTNDPALEKTLLARRDELRLRASELQRRIRDAHQRINDLLADQRGFAADHSAVELRFAHQQAKEHLAAAHDQWTSLTLQQAVLAEAQSRLHHEEHSRVITEASAYLHRLTQGRYTNFYFDPVQRELFIRNSDGQMLPSSALSRGTLDQTALSFRLALVAEYARRGVRLPLVLDDVLVDSDEHRLWAAIAVLREVAANGQQVIFLTCQEHLSDLFDENGQPVRLLYGGVRLAARSSSMQRSSPSRVTTEVVASHFLANPPATVTVPSPEVAVSPIPHTVDHSGEADHSLRSRLQPEGPYWLRVDSAIGLLPSLGNQMASRLGSLGVSNLGELILLDVDSLGSELDALQITVAQLRLWQAEAALLTCVPDLTGAEAQLLALMGIDNPAELGAEDVDTLRQRIEHARQGGAGFDQVWALNQVDGLDSDRLQSWIRNGRRAMTLRAASQWAGWKPRSLHDLESHDWDRALRERAERQRRTREREDRELAERNSRRRSPSDPAEKTLPLIANESTSESNSGGTRFYLETTSPVVDAPSIGPKMADKLAKIGIVSVSDFLSRKAQWIADKLSESKLNVETLRTWQMQSSLMCQVPGLRGHDAQLLVGCDITTPEQIRGYSPADLLAVVGPFAESREGQRMLRSANAPDLDEVQDWINWAREARQVRVA